MTTAKITVSLDPVVAERARRDVADGKSTSVSAWLNEAGRARLERDDLESVLDAIFEATGGPLSELELQRASSRLAAADQR